MIKMERPDYNRIYLDILKIKFPEMLPEYEKLLIDGKELSVLEVVKLNEAIFGTRSKVEQRQNQKYKSYDKTTIIQILEYQKSNRLNNTQLAACFRLSRNTVTAWKKLFVV